MRIGELSARTGVPTPTIKYYVREGLLSGGERISSNQVSYDEGHVRRLRLVRALVEIGSLPIAKVREVLSEVDSPDRDLGSRLGIVGAALSARQDQHEATAPADLDTAMAIAERNGWTRMTRDHHQIATLAEVVGTLRLLGLEELIDRADQYARAANLVAAADIAVLKARSDRDEVLETMIVGTVFGDALFGALRRIAQVETSALHFKQSDKRHGFADDR
ncbi:MerR family transcriptional regulator [Glycomyces xiaoerkulensis]|uniref:MerR family transcriptional regulator n=1 Tax=Glycomyces xiaoerkulensis TaxID=2038139 RepID=UPI000C262894|nr:MerR family transcriptional regulator [Glycomyces xiaoerkulensis]